MHVHMRGLSYTLACMSALWSWNHHFLEETHQHRNFHYSDFHYLVCVCVCVCCAMHSTKLGGGGGGGEMNLWEKSSVEVKVNVVLTRLKHVCVSTVTLVCLVVDDCCHGNRLFPPVIATTPSSKREGV